MAFRCSVLRRGFPLPTWHPAEYNNALKNNLSTWPRSQKQFPRVLNLCECGIILIQLITLIHEIMPMLIPMQNKIPAFRRFGLVFVWLYLFKQHFLQTYAFTTYSIPSVLLNGKWNSISIICILFNKWFTFFLHGSLHLVGISLDYWIEVFVPSNLSLVSKCRY